MLRLAMLTDVFRVTLELRHAVRTEDSLTVRLRLVMLVMLLVRPVVVHHPVTV